VSFLKSEKFIVMHSKDNCATSLVALVENESVELLGRKVIIKQQIPMGHKFALNEIKKGDNIIKYGEIIGIATDDIHIGEWIHIHNIKSHYLEVSKQ
jgi:altronate dehydratase